MEKDQLYEQILKTKEELVSLTSDFWQQYASFDTWFFWVNIATIIIPLVILYFFIERKRLFEICFYGYTAHVLWSNVDNIMSMHNFIIHPHSLTHMLLVGITVTTVLFPVTFMCSFIKYVRNISATFTYMQSLLHSFFPLVLVVFL